MSDLRVHVLCGVVISAKPRALCLRVLEEFVTEDLAGQPGATWTSSGDPGRLVTEDGIHPHWKYEWSCPDHPDADHQLNGDRVLGFILEVERTFWDRRAEVSPFPLSVGVLPEDVAAAREWDLIDGVWVLRLLQ